MVSSLLNVVHFEARLGREPPWLLQLGEPNGLTRIQLFSGGVLRLNPRSLFEECGQFLCKILCHAFVALAQRGAP